VKAIEVSGLTKRYGRVAAEIIAGYVLGFLGLATSQAIAGLEEAIWLFELDYDEETLVMLFAVVWLLAIASVMPGIFISTFARHEDQVFPFVSLIILPSVFLSGLLVDVDELPTWADWLGHAFPLFWANDVIQDVNRIRLDVRGRAGEPSRARSLQRGGAPPRLPDAPGDRVGVVKLAF
jgi:hypothetical protein